MFSEAQQFPWGIIFLLFGLWMCYEIDRGRKREGKGGIPILGPLFDSIIFTVHEEVVDLSVATSSVKKEDRGKKVGPQKKKKESSRSKSPLQRKKSKRSRRSKREKEGKRSGSPNSTEKTSDKGSKISSGSSSPVTSNEEKKKKLQKKIAASLPTKKGSREKSLDSFDMVDDD